jgi:hypothetical protein
MTLAKSITVLYCGSVIHHTKVSCSVNDPGLKARAY